MDAMWEAYSHECARQQGELSSPDSGSETEEEGGDSDDLKKKIGSPIGLKVKGADPSSWVMLQYAPLKTGSRRVPILPPLPADRKDVLKGMKKVIRALVTQCYCELSSIYCYYYYY